MTISLCQVALSTCQYYKEGNFQQWLPHRWSLQFFLQAWAKGTSYEACVEATAGPDDGTVLRAPTEKQGLIPLCKDTFLGKVRALPATVLSNPQPL